LKQLTDLDEWRPIPWAREAAAADFDSVVVAGGPIQLVKRAMTQQTWSRRRSPRLGIGRDLAREEEGASELAMLGDRRTMVAGRRGA
jgi:hypothetical protein